MNYVSHSYNNPVDFCINACTTDMNAVVYDTYHASDNDTYHASDNDIVNDNINACTTDMNAVVYDTYHASDNDKLLMIIYLLQVPIM